MEGTTRKTAKDRALDLVALALSVSLWATPRVVPPCSHELLTASGASVPMRCHWSFQGQSLIAGVAILVAVVSLVAGLGERRRSRGGFIALLALMAIGVNQSWVIGLCGRSEMSCHTTAHWTWAWAGLLVVVGGLIVGRSERSDVARSVADPWDSPAGAKGGVG